MSVLHHLAQANRALKIANQQDKFGKECVPYLDQALHHIKCYVLKNASLWEYSKSDEENLKKDINWDSPDIYDKNIPPLTYCDCGETLTDYDKELNNTCKHCR